MYSWRADYENGSSAELRFSDNTAELCIRNPDHEILFSGVCITTDDRLIICDKKSGRNITFGYTVHGDRVDLSYNGGILTLDKS